VRGCAKKLKTGRCKGRKPYGFREDERKVLEQMRTLRTDGVSFNQIATRLNEQSVPPRSGQCWHAFTVSKILARNVKSATGSSTSG
jgi:hypothetical protein